MEITTQMIKELRDATKAGILDCRKALTEANGDFQKAVDYLREKGMATAAKRADRDASQGTVELYSHGGGRVGVMVEVNCETDFVARTDEFRTLAREIAMQVASMDPQSVGTLDGADGDGTALLNQEYIRDSRKTIRDLVKETIGKVGENIQVSQFKRFEVGASAATDPSDNGAREQPVG